MRRLQSLCLKVIESILTDHPLVFFFAIFSGFIAILLWLRQPVELIYDPAVPTLEQEMRWCQRHPGAC